MSSQSPDNGLALRPRAPDSGYYAAKVVAGKSLQSKVRDISPEEFDRLHKSIKPQPGEWAWAEIPWLTDLWEARNRAATEGKPIFVWSTTPHPLGNI